MKLKTILELLAIFVVVLVFDQLVHNYLLFHVIAELFSISILFVLFAVTWNARKFISNKYLLFVGIAAIFIGFLDLLHTITYNGMNIIPSKSFFANQFWIATRSFESLVLLSGFLFLTSRKNIRVPYLIAIYSTITAGIVLSILFFRNFPVCFIENIGQTPFKIISEYVIISILITAFILLYRGKNYFERETHVFLSSSIVLAIASEFCFTLYAQNYGLTNQVGHIFKIMAFYMIYKANIQNGFTSPIQTFFREMKLNEIKIKEYNQELETQIATRNRFFSIIAHDLKNPFTILSGMSEFLVDNYDHFEDEDRKKFIKTIHDTSEDIFMLVENLLTWSRSQMGNLTYHPVYFDIREVLDDSIMHIQMQASVKEIMLCREYSTEMVWADPDMVKVVLRNFLSNAVKFTPKSGKVTLQTSREKDHLKIIVTDTGVGIPKSKIKDLFRLDVNHSTKGTDNESGTGLGLILCNEFVRLNKGIISINSEVNKGSSFSFTLPLSKETADASLSQKTQKENRKSSTSAIISN